MNGVSEQDDPLAPRGGGPSVALACVALYLAVVLGLFLAIRHRDNGVFTYTLDDPYIHLALAQSLAHGHYGINPGEPSSPSSSVLWPFLLVPFAAHPSHLALVYIPLLWNVLFCATAAWRIACTVSRWSWVPDRWSWGPRGWSGSSGPTASPLTRFLLAAALMLVANLAGLTFVGMEHGLQVLLAIACAAGLAEAFAGRPIPAWSLAAAVLGPMVRYENFALVAAVAVALYGLGRTRAAVAIAALSLLGPGLFSRFLLSRGLPALPSSVLVKANIYTFYGGALHAAIATISQSMQLRESEVGWWDQLAVALLLLFLMLADKQRARRFILGGASLAALLQLILGPFNWFYRYEVYAIVFTALVAATALAESTRVPRIAVAAGLLALGAPYAVALYDTPTAAANVYQQQYQMHRFLAGFHGSVVAVNDLGLVSYDRPPGLYVLDLWGLASPEASRQTYKDGDWLDAITRAHAARLAILYPDWYPEGAPDDWDPLGTMCITGRRASIARKCVVFYSTGLGDQPALQAQLASFALTLPPSVKMTLGKDTTDVDNAP